MAVSEDLINFDIIETQKENIQSLPSGRSAKALATAFGATPFSPIPAPGSTRNLNDTLRAEYEQELRNINDADDPLDVYDRYVKWTLNAYPSAQATPESQLRPLLERATKAFQSVAHYKNDPRYLKLWMHYIRFFSDAPREAFAYLARHGIGEGLALYYEEFAAWLESASRWNQAEEVYKLGLEREARPTERLLRKFGEFQTRFEQQPHNADEPSSPALPTVRPALAAKLDPFASSTPRPTDPQAQRLPSTNNTSRSGKTKLAIFSDNEPPQEMPPSGSEDARGWDNIGSIAERKKENTIEARPWVGETLKAGRKAGTGPKLAVFKDESNPPPSCEPTAVLLPQRTTTNTKTGRLEHVFAQLDAVYPDPSDLSQEYSFEELRARHRGWLQKSWQIPAPAQRPVSWQKESQDSQDTSTQFGPQDMTKGDSQDTTANIDSQDMTNNIDSQDLTTSDLTISDFTVGGTKKPRNGKDRGRPKRKKVMEVKGETQTVKLNLDSPTKHSKPKRRSMVAEPTMTLHTKAANADMLDIFNAPLGHVATLGEVRDSDDGESDYDTDDYTCTSGGAESTGRVSAPSSEYGDDGAPGVDATEMTQGVDVTEMTQGPDGTESSARSVGAADTTEGSVRSADEPESTTDEKSVSAWSEFTRSKHVPTLRTEDSSKEAVNTGDWHTGLESIPESSDHQTPESIQECIPRERTHDLIEANLMPAEESRMPGQFEDEPEDEDEELDFIAPSAEPAEDELDFVAAASAEPSPPVEVFLPADRPTAIPISSDDDWDLPLPQAYQMRANPYRDPAAVAQRHLPFMTPIVERTECSFPSIARTHLAQFAAADKTESKDASFDLETPCVASKEAKDYFSKTPSRRRAEDPALPQIDDLLLSSPFQEIVNEARPNRGRAEREAFAEEEPAISLASSIISVADEKVISLASSVISLPPDPAVAVAPEPAAAPDALLLTDLQVNPLDLAIRAAVLALAQPTLDALPSYYDHRPAACGQGPALRRFIKTLKTAKPSELAAPCLDAGSAVYTVKRELGQGAFAPVYLATAAPPDGLRSYVAIKAEDPPSAWEFHLMTLAHQRLASHRAAASLAAPLALHLFADEGYLVESYHDQGTLLDLSNLSASAVAAGGAPLLDECVVAFFATELLRAVLALHAVGILHGDVKADNCLVRLATLPDSAWAPAYAADGADGWADKGVTLIDFGRGIDRRAFAPATTFVADWTPRADDCPAVRAARPWTVHSDYWGAAGVLHLLLFGKWMEDVEDVAARPAAADDAFHVYDDRAAGMGMGMGTGMGISTKRYRLREPFRRYWQTELWSGVFDALMNPNPMAGPHGVDAQVGRLEAYLAAHAERRGLKAGLRRCEERIREGRRRK